MAGVSPAPFADRLLTWWDRHGRKDLPWQHPRTPYRVWISEIMLQQTQVSTVIPYFKHWFTDFPDIGTLARSSLDDVLSHWSGLGYYARARNIHKSALLCLEQHGGDLPESAEQLNALPGIGLSTANAIVSQSSDKPAAVLDGNVRRTLARHTATEGWTGKSQVQKQLWAAAEARLPAKRGADYTQAIMDLGALVCTRRRPGCDTCPVSEDCQALALGQVDELPTPKPAARIGEMTLHLLIIRDEKGRVLLEKRPPSGIWGGLWCLPEKETVLSIGEKSQAQHQTAIPHMQHRLSHLCMTIKPTLVTAAPPGQVKCSTDMDWFDRGQQQSLGLPKPIKDLLNRLEKGEFE